MKLRLIGAIAATMMVTACAGSPAPSSTASPTPTNSTGVPTNSATPSASYSPPPIKQTSWLTSIDKVIHANKYWEEFSYPVFSSSHVDNAAINRIVRNLNREMTEFVTSFEARTKKSFGSANANEWTPSTLILTGIQEIGSEHLLFIRIEHYESAYEQAHGDGSTWTDVFDLRTGELLNLENQILEDRKEVFINLVIANLFSQVGADAIDPENVLRDQLGSWDDFICWSIANDGLSITFNTYVVGPYASGTPAVSIPWQSLSTIINPKSVIGREFAAQLNYK